MVSDGQHLPQGVLPLSAGDEQGEGNFWEVQQLPVQGEHVEVDEGSEVVHPFGQTNTSKDYLSFLKFTCFSVKVARLE